jgi:hypothetical protein
MKLPFMDIHPLKDFLIKSKINPERFATENLGIRAKSIYRYFTSRHGAMSRAVKLRVQSSTDGAVTAIAITEWENQNLPNKPELSIQDCPRISVAS